MKANIRVSLEDYPNNVYNKLTINRKKYIKIVTWCPIHILIHYTPVVQFIFILKHPKRLHCLNELLSVDVVNLSGKSQADGGGNAIVFLRLLLPTKRTDTGPVCDGHACSIGENIIINLSNPPQNTQLNHFTWDSQCFDFISQRSLSDMHKPMLVFFSPSDTNLLLSIS